MCQVKFQRQKPRIKQAFARVSLVHMFANDTFFCIFFTDAGSSLEPGDIEVKPFLLKQNSFSDP